MFRLRYDSLIPQLRTGGLLLGLLCLTAAPCRADERGDFFEQHIRPLLLNRCIECHGPQKQEGGVRLDRRDAVLQGRAGDVALVQPGQAAASRIVQVLAHAEDDVQMPPSAKLPDEQRALVEQWINDGAVWPMHADLEQDARRRAEQWREHWAFQKPVRPDLSQLPPDLHPVDYFIRRALSARQLQPSPAAGMRVLTRRLSDALVGLPPELQDYEQAEAAEAAGQRQQWLTAYVDRLLASPHFGERWGRYWLDVSRYADTKGYVFQEDREYPEAWKYREWVIRALNSDMPYDEFLKRQLAADRLPGSDDGAQLAAMGYLTLGRRFLNNKHDIIDDRIDVTIRGMLGLTAGCARCHDHKFDPIPTADYYSLYGIFDSSDEPKNEPSTLRLVDRAEPVNPVIFVRGQAGNRGDPVPRRFLTALSGPDAKPFTDGSGRLELANAIASPDNPLTARVAVNRVWMHLFGRSMVDSPSDFGVRTPPPTHPELLDDLAIRFVEQGWSTKSLIRHIVTSQTWQQSSAARADVQAVDPENRLLTRMNRRRMDFEAHRDAILAVSGRLDLTVGGPSVDITAADPGVRRTIYARIDRQNLPGVFRTFDLASPDTHAPQRFETTVPQQALFQLNNPFVMDQAEAVSEAVQATAAATDARIHLLFQRVLRRTPTAAELAGAQEFLAWFAETQTSSATRSGWSYGFGTLDEASGRVTQFTLLPKFHKGSWQGGRQLPDPVLGWVMLNRSGGHAGADLQHCAVRRFMTDVDCELQIDSELVHSQEQGNGVRGRVVVSTGGVLADAVAHHSSVPLKAASVSLPAGQWLDFVVDSRGEQSHDSFGWKISMTQTAGGAVVQTWNSEQDFGQRQSQPLLDAWAQLAQTLLLTNEFVFVD